MPIGDIAAGILEVIGRFLLDIFLQVVVEILIRGPGIMIMKLLVPGGREDFDPDGIFVIVIGVMFWVVLGCAGYFTYQFVWVNN